MSKRLQYLVVSCSTCLLAVFLLGAVMGRGNAAEDAYKHFSVFTEVISRIKSEYVEETDMKNVTLGALNGLLESLDPYASYLSAEQYKQYLKAKETKKGDVGLILSRRFGYVGIVDAVPGSPASKQGLGTGDVIETIANVATRDMPLAYAEMLLMGDPGTTVDVSVLRVRRGAEAQKITLTRAPVEFPGATLKQLPGDVGHIVAATLEPRKAAEIAARVNEAVKAGAKRLVLDLRSNAGGTPEEGVALANLFLDRGRVAYLEGQKVARRNIDADPSKAITKLPLVVLVNRGTAGGAEIAASALLDNKRAEVVGERTYGEAAERKALTLDDGAAVILSVAKYYNAAGKAIQDNGLTPSLPVAGPEPDSDDDDGPAAAPAPAAPAEDLQLQKAIEVLTKGMAAVKESMKQTAARSGRDGAAGDRNERNLKPVTPLGVPRKQ
jgi:carboxyl-terminal processing protease